MTVFWMDGSKHDRARRAGPLDWAAIGKALGQSSVMCARMSYGDPSVFAPASDYWDEMQRDARAAGYDCRGGYHNIIHGDAASIARQVDYHRRRLDAYGTQWSMLDAEPYQELVDRNLQPRWDDVRRWRDRWAAVDERVCVGYFAGWVWSQWGCPDLREWPWPIINAHYGGGDGSAAQIYAAAGGDTAAGWSAYGHRVPDALQFTSQANVAGATGQTDTNAYRGTLDELTALLTGETMPTAEEIAKAVWTYNPIVSPNGRDHYSAPGFAVDTVVAARAVHEQDVPAILAGIQQLLGRDPLTADEVVNGVLAGLASKPAAEAAAALKAVLSPEQVSALVAALGQ